MPDKLVYRDPKELTLSPNNVRKINPETDLNKLTDSIVEKGILHPIVINQKNQVVAGQRRWLASLKGNKSLVQCIQREYKDDKEEIYDSLIENLLHQLLDDRDIARAILKLKDLGETYEDISRTTGYPESRLHYTAMIETVPQAIKERVEKETDEETKKLAKKAGEIVLDTTIRRRTLMDRAINLSKFKDDIRGLHDFLKWSKEAPLHDIEQALKDAKENVPVDLEKRKEMTEIPTVMFHTRFLKEPHKKSMKRCKLENKDPHKVIAVLWYNFGEHKVDLD